MTIKSVYYILSYYDGKIDVVICFFLFFPCQEELETMCLMTEGILLHSLAESDFSTIL